MQNLAFIIPDHLIDTAVRALRDAGFPDEDGLPRCSLPQLVRDESNGIMPLPCHRFRLEEDIDWMLGPAEIGGICLEDIKSIKESYEHPELVLYRKSEFLWAMPDFTLELPGPNDPNFMLANDRRLPAKALGKGSGRVEDPNCRLKILTPARFIEMNLLLEARDWNNADAYIWDRDLYHVLTYTVFSTADPSLTEPQSLQSRFRPLWSAWLSPNASYRDDMIPLYVKLREDLHREGTLPPSPFLQRTV